MDLRKEWYSFSRKKKEKKNQKQTQQTHTQNKKPTQLFSIVTSFILDWLSWSVLKAITHVVTFTFHMQTEREGDVA